ncbi:MAG: SLBB domain-containing protein, partial [Chlamydiia bacterium]|nr:SLBB domain-containing protein [Chlamydiia bacterium]
MPVVSIQGEVRRPGTYKRSYDMTLLDLLRIAGGPTDEAYQGVNTIVRRV